MSACDVTHSWYVTASNRRRMVLMVSRHVFNNKTVRNVVRQMQKLRAYSVSSLFHQQIVRGPISQMQNDELMVPPCVFLPKASELFHGILLKRITDHVCSLFRPQWVHDFVGQIHISVLMVSPHVFALRQSVISLDGPRKFCSQCFLCFHPVGMGFRRIDAD